MSKDKLLKKLGFDPEKVEADDFDLAEAVTDFEANQKEKYNKLFKNDTEYAESIAEKAREDVYKALDKRFSKHLDKDEMEKFKQVGDKITGLVKKLENGGSEDIKELQEKNHQLQEQLDGKDEEIETARKEAESKASGTVIQYKLREKFANIPSEEIIGSGNTAFKLVMGNVRDKYDFRLEDDDVKIYVKGKDQQAEKDNAFLKVEDMLRTGLKDEELVRESNGEKKPEEQKTPTEGERTSERTGDTFTKKSKASERWAKEFAKT